MNKFYALLIFLFVGTMQADPLSDAIRASDITKVRLLISQSTLTEKQVIKYLDTAEQIIRVRHENFLLNGGGCAGDFPSDRYPYRAKILKWSAIGVCIATPLLARKIFDIMPPSDESEKIICSFVAGVFAFAISLNALAFVVIGIKMSDLPRIRTLCADSITIKELFYDLL